MASPVVATTNTGSTGSTATTSHVINMPASIAAGDTLTVEFEAAGTATHSAPGDWTKLGQATNSVSESVFTKVAAGGDTLTVTTSASVRSSHVSRRVTGSDGTVEATSATGSGTNGNPPSITPTGGSKDYLFVASLARANATVPSAAPTNYTNLLTATGTGNSIGSAERQLTAASEDPGTFTSGSSNWVAWTIAYHPAGGAQQDVTANSISSTVAVGQPAVTAGAVTVSPNSIASTTAVGQPSVTAGSVTVSPNSIAATTVVGSPTVSTTVTISPDSIASTVVVGEPSIAGSGTIVPDSIASTATIGEPAVQPGAVTVSPDSIVTTVAVGEPGVTPVTTVSPGSISSTLVVGEPAVSVGQVAVSPDSIAATTVVGEPAVSPGSVTVSPASIGSTTTVGQPSFSATITVSPDSITSTAVVGEPGVTTSVTVVAESIEPTALVGEPTVQSIQTIAPRSIQSTTVFGDPGVFHRMWELVIPLVTEQHPWRRSLTAPLPEGETVYGTDAGLVSKRQPRNADLEGATRVYWAGHVHRTQDVVERDLWVDSGFEVNEVLV